MLNTHFSSLLQQTANSKQNTVDKEICRKATCTKKRKFDADDHKDVLGYKDIQNPDNLELFVSKQRINVDGNGKCLSLPFIFNDISGTPAEEKLYDYLKFVGEECNENMIIIHSYKHEGNRGVFVPDKRYNSTDPKRMS